MNDIYLAMIRDTKNNKIHRIGNKKEINIENADFVTLVI